MATLQYPFKGAAALSGGKIPKVRIIDVNVRMATDVTMGTATDDIVVADLPAGTIVLGAGIEQTAVGTGTGTLVARVGSTTLSATLASTAAVGTMTASASATLPIVLNAASTLNVLGATAVRTDGQIRVWAIVALANPSPAIQAVAARDTSL